MTHEIPVQGTIVVPIEGVVFRGVMMQPIEHTVLSVIDYTGTTEEQPIGWIAQTVETWVADDMLGRGWTLDELNRMTSYLSLSRDEVAEVRPVE